MAIFSNEKIKLALAAFQVKNKTKQKVEIVIIKQEQIQYRRVCFLKSLSKT